MIKSTTIAVIVTTVFSTSALASKYINFSNPYALYNGLSVGYGSNDIDVKAQFTSQVDPHWDLLGTYHSDENFNNHDLRLNVIHRTGVGYFIGYDYDSNYGDKGLRAKTGEIGVHVNVPISRNVRLIPEMALGSFSHNSMSNNASFTQLSLNMTYDTRKNIWFSVTPEYTFSFNDLKEDNGRRSSFRSWDLIADAGYSINRDQSLVYSYQYDAGNHQSTVSYRLGF
ncbi:hypothetical protein LNL84_08865 [Vibrio sp. ZSDZ34]|jgi:hypothetical protein|uniref:Outer membrane protein beta-barrel domain-containing protein n=1 Tax=Vibrio gelatinilyticus TaxID=2893468 RepID=A0A9X2AW22_9VIBR|nr:hypothetical protein [Vibrio gelatinilyticus]MCJ2376945.1 hypothetical protein [Vibrio gelatinilyticus]